MPTHKGGKKEGKILLLTDGEERGQKHARHETCQDLGADVARLYPREAEHELPGVRLSAVSATGVLGWRLLLILGADGDYHRPLGGVIAVSKVIERISRSCCRGHGPGG